MIEVFNKIYLDNRLLSFNELNLSDFSIDELRFLKSIYSSKEEKIDKFIEKQKLSSYTEKEISKKRKPAFRGLFYYLDRTGFPSTGLKYTSTSFPSFIP